MKKLQMIPAFFGFLFFPIFSVAQPAIESIPEKWRVETHAASSIENVVEREMGIKMLVSPLKSDTSQFNRYKPSSVITYDRKGNLYRKYDYVYDQNGFGYGGNEAMVRNFYQWNSDSNRWLNLERYKVILDENGDMTEYYTDKGNGDRWENDYRFEATYDEAHHPLLSTQILWLDGEWFPMLRWKNEYDAGGRITEQSYENRYTSSAWTPGLRIKWSYDASGNELSYSQESYQNGSYMSLLMNEYEYDTNGNRIRWEQSSYGKKVTRIDYTYDTAGNITKELTSKWKGDQWQEYTFSQVAFDASNRPVFGLLTVKDSLGEWDSVERYTVMYAPTASNKEIWQYADSLKAWQKIERWIYQYNTNGQLTAFARDRWVASKNLYETEVRDVYTYNENFDLVAQKTENRSVDEEGNIVWTPGLDFSFFYDENRNADSAIAVAKPTKSYLFLPYNRQESEWGCPEEESWAVSSSYLDLEAFVHAESISLDMESAEMLVGDSLILQESVLPVTADNREVYWSSSDENIVRVDVDGKIFAIAEGSATIAVRSLENRDCIAECQVTVKKSVGNEIGSGIVSVFDVYSRDRTIYVNGGKESDRVMVVDATGRTVYCGMSRRIPVEKTGIYLIRMGTGVKKLVVL